MTVLKNVLFAAIDNNIVSNERLSKILSTYQKSLFDFVVERNAKYQNETLAKITYDLSEDKVYVRYFFYDVEIEAVKVCAYSTFDTNYASNNMIVANVINMIELILYNK